MEKNTGFTTKGRLKEIDTRRKEQIQVMGDSLKGCGFALHAGGLCIIADIVWLVSQAPPEASL